MTPADIATHPLYALCTVRERAFLDAYCYAESDIIEAVTKSYHLTGSQASSKARHLMGLTRIVKLMRLIDGAEQPSADDVAQQYLLMSQTAKTDRARLDALDRYAEMKHYIKTGTNPPSTADAQRAANEWAKRIDGATPKETPNA